VFAFLFALESEAIGENAQFHKDPKCARIVVESYIDDFPGAGRCSELECLRKLTRALFKLEVSDLIQIRVDGLFSYHCTGTEHDSRVLGKLSRYLITHPEREMTSHRLALSELGVAYLTDRSNFERVHDIANLKICTCSFLQPKGCLLSSACETTSKTGHKIPMGTTNSEEIGARRGQSLTY